jgi:hypothetical protein
LISKLRLEALGLVTLTGTKVNGNDAFGLSAVMNIRRQRWRLICLFDMLVLMVSLVL